MELTEAAELVFDPTHELGIHVKCVRRRTAPRYDQNVLADSQVNPKPLS